MPYETLEKISYRQPGQYEAIYEARLNDPETVRLDFEINGWTAFRFIKKISMQRENWMKRQLPRNPR